MWKYSLQNRLGVHFSTQFCGSSTGIGDGHCVSSVVTSPRDESRCLQATSLKRYSTVCCKVLQFASSISTLLVPKSFFCCVSVLHHELNTVYNTSTKEPQNFFLICSNCTATHLSSKPKLGSNDVAVLFQISIHFTRNRVTWAGEYDILLTVLSLFITIA
jgi:hypothetical protein